MELAALVSLASGILSQLLEVGHSLGDSASEQTDLNATSGLSSDGDIKPNLLFGNKGGGEPEISDWPLNKKFLF